MTSTTSVPTHDALVHTPAGDEHRPWGWYRQIDTGEGFKVKRIHVHVGGQLSLQSHAQRAEHWVVVRGEATVELGGRTMQLRIGGHVDIALGQKHRLSNFAQEPLELIEVQFGHYLGEDDIVRYTDVYGRS